MAGTPAKPESNVPVRFPHFSVGALSLALSLIFLIVAYYEKNTGGAHEILDALQWWMKIIWVLLAVLAAFVSVRSLNAAAWDFLRNWGGLLSLTLLLLFFLLMSGVTAVRATSQTQPHDSGTPAWGVLLIGLLLVVPLVVWFLRVFTTPLKREEAQDPSPETVAAVTQMVLFSYCFILIAFAISVLPFLLILFLGHQGIIFGREGNTSFFYDRMVASPIGFVRGCVHAPSDPNWELACHFANPEKNDPGDKYSVQWLVNIGGSALLRDSIPPKDQKDKEPAELLLKDTPEAEFPAVTVHGGLAIPWYFIAVALMGAAVSMARKVPEYQRKALDKAYTTFSGPEAREYLVFQVLQVFSAPLIAITAYNLISPNNRATSVALAFTSGFASESVLLAIRALVDKLDLMTTGEPPSSEEKTKTVDRGANAAKAIADGAQRKLADLGDDPIKLLRDALAGAPPEVAAKLSDDLKAAQAAFDEAKTAVAASRTHADEAVAAAAEAAASSSDPAKVREATARAQKASDAASADSHNFERAMAAFKAAEEKILSGTAKG